MFKIKKYLFLLYPFFCSLLVLVSFDLDSKPQKLKEKFFYAYLFFELEKEVLKRDRTLSYFPSIEKKENCEQVEVFYQDLAWDKKGIYPAYFLDIKILCKPKNQKIILVLGDSITAGASLGREKTYPAILNHKFTNVYFLNAGINGSNTYHWRRGGILFKKIISENKDLLDGIIVLIGGNNILFIEHVLKRKALPTEVSSEILGLVQEIQAELPDLPIYIGNYPMAHVMSEEMYLALEKIRTNTYGTKRGPEVYSKFKNRWDLYMSDYLHLNEKGQKLLALIWEEHLKKDGWK